MSKTEDKEKRDARRKERQSVKLRPRGGRMSGQEEEVSLEWGVRRTKQRNWAGV